MALSLLRIVANRHNKLMLKNKLSLLSQISL